LREMRHPPGPMRGQRVATPDLRTQRKRVLHRPRRAPFEHDDVFSPATAELPEWVARGCLQVRHQPVETATCKRDIVGSYTLRQTAMW
jgi:hypothetical protein